MTRLLLFAIVGVAVLLIAPLTARSGIVPGRSLAIDTKDWNEIDEALEGDTEDAGEQRESSKEDGTVEERHDRRRDFVENVEED